MQKRINMALVALLAATPAAILFSPAPAIGANTLQSVLSTAGLSAYDTATSGSYFAVSQSDFDNAASNLASVTKVGMSDVQRTDACAITWSNSYLVVMDNTIKIPANAYILGYAVRLLPSVTGTQYSRLASSTTYKGSYDYLIGSSYPTTVAGMNYYLFKEPQTSASTRYLGIWSSANQCGVPFTTSTGGYRGPSSGPFSGIFTSQSGNFPFLQLLYTTVDQWSIPTTISLSASGAATSSTKGGSIGISTTQNKDGLVTFKANGKNIAQCISLQSSSMTVTCNWKPTNQGPVQITASLRSPTSAYAAVTSAPLQISINKRSTRR
jgi:hypothetical protein